MWGSMGIGWNGGFTKYSPIPKLLVGENTLEVNKALARGVRDYVIDEKYSLRLEI
jgi:hypothetical protein